MALQYPGSAPIPQYGNALDGLMEGLEIGDRKRKLFDAQQTLAGNTGAKQPNALERLVGLFGGQQHSAQQGPSARPETAVAAIDQAAPADPNVWGPKPGLPNVDPNVWGPRPDATGYAANVRTAESGGNDQARNPNSTATGRYQFLEPTWNGLAQKYPELGLTADGRTDPAQQERAMARFTQDNAGALGNAGIPVNPGNLYAAHFLGAGGATKALSADPATPMSALVDPGVIEANPHLANMTAGDFAQWANSKGGNSAGGYSAPMPYDQPSAGRARQFTPEEIGILFAAEETRPFALSIVQAQQAQGQNAGRYEVQEMPDGSVRQIDRMTGETQILQQPGAALDAEYKRAQIDALQAKPAVPPTDDQREYEMAKSQGFTGTFLEFKAAQRSNSGLSIRTNPDGTTEIIQGDLSGMPKLTEGQSKDVGFLTRGAGANDVLNNLDTELTDLGGNIAGAVPGGNALQSEAYQQANQAGLEFLAALLRKDSGGAITPEENKGYGDIYLPRFGDKPAVIEQKRAARARALAAIKLGLPPASILALETDGVDLSGASIGIAPPVISAPSDLPVPEGVVFSTKEQYDAAPSGTVYIAPDGTTRTKP